MALTALSTTARNAACDAVVDLLDGGTIQLQTSGDTEVATLTFGSPAFGAAAAGVATANAIAQDAGAAGGTIDATDGLVVRAAGTGDPVVFKGSMSTTGGGGDGEISSLVIGATDVVSCSAFTVTMPAAA